MSNLSPSVAAELARDVYTVQSPIEFKVFLMRPEFSSSNREKVKLSVIELTICLR